VTRIPTLFAVAGVVVLVVGLLSSRMGLRSGMSLTWHGTGYLLGNSLLCFGAGVFFCLFAFLYSLWMVPWSAQAGWWHFGLSLLCIGMFCIGLLVPERSVPGDGPALTLPLLIAFTASAPLFLAVQGLFLVDGLRRCWPLLFRS